MSNPLAESLKFILHRGEHYIFNRSDATLERIRLVETSKNVEMKLVYPSPVYEISDIPPDSYTSLPEKSKTGSQRWGVQEATWSNGAKLEGHHRFISDRKWGGTTFSETQVDREVRYLGMLPERRIGEEWDQLKEFGKLYAQRIAVYRDTKRRMLLLNLGYTDSEWLKITKRHYKKRSGPGNYSSSEETLLVDGLPARSFVPLLNDFDTNQEKFEFELKGGRWDDGKTYEDERTLRVLNRLHSKPLEERELQSVHVDVKSNPDEGK